MALFQNRYRIDTARLAHFDYSSPGEYFVTICTKGKICHFGNITNGQMCLSEIGSIVQEEWQNTTRVRPKVELDAFVVMPNHIHGIIIICKSLEETTDSVVSQDEKTIEGKTRRIVSSLSETTHRVVSTGNKPMRVVSTGNKSKTLQPNSLGSIVGQFKSVCTKRIHAVAFHDFAWQPRYYDHIIRDEKDLERIREYIAMNPSRWGSEDEFASNIHVDPMHKDG